MHPLKEYLKSRKITLDWLEDKTGFSRTHVCLVLNGKKKLTPKLFKALYNALIKDEPKDAELVVSQLETLWK